MALKNNINTYADMTAYNADSTKEYPNVSYIIATDEVVWMESEPIVPKAIYNVTSTSSATKLLNTTTGITKQIIDGVEQSSVVTEYTFNTTGEHVVEYELANNQIGDNAFKSCINLTSITIPNSVTIIGDSTFQYCDNLTSIIIPDSVTTIGDWAFYQCANLTTVTIGNSVTSIGKYAFQSCYKLISITLPDSVTTIGDSAFQYCGLANVTIGNSVTIIGKNAFRECSNLTNVTIGNSVTSIALSAFFGCSSLTNITIPDSVTSIDNWAFFDCSRLANVTVEASTPPTLGSDAFANNASGRKIYVPSGSVSTYQSASGWSDYASDIVAIQNS